MHSSRIRCSTQLLIALILAGCSGAADEDRQPVYPVTGKVTTGGAPVANAVVTFSPQGDQPAAVGRTNSSGEFTLTTYDPGDGAAAGEYKVMVSKETAAPAATAGGHDPVNYEQFDPGSHSAAPSQVETTSGLPEKYSRADLTPLTATIKAGENPPLEFDLQP